MRNEIIKNYMRYLKLGRNFSKNTLDAYYHDLNFLLEYADKNNLVLTEMKLEDLENFSASLHDRGVSARSQARILSGIRSFYRYPVLDDYIKRRSDRITGFSPNRKAFAGVFICRRG